MQLPSDLREQAIQDVLREHPAIGPILARYDVGCVGCAVGICLLQDIVSIHALSEDAEAALVGEINTYLASLQARPFQERLKCPA